jgi:hypothetical protein
LNGVNMHTIKKHPHFIHTIQTFISTPTLILYISHHSRVDTPNSPLYSRYSLYGD